MPKMEFKGKLPPPEEFKRMLVEAVLNSNPVEELLELHRELQGYETKYGLSSEEFYEKYNRGEMGDSAEIMHWAALYQSFLELKRLLERALIRKAVMEEVTIAV
ncbi:MAG TPA: hypothetical protein ENG33_06555 [Chloroflexi bacterium]|nr:hypothetical protein [Chloroflexota bacterium]